MSGDSPTLLHDADEKIKNANQLLTKPEYQLINAEYETTKKRKKNASWYTLFNGPDNLEQLAMTQRLEGLYEVLYRTWSKTTHGTDIIQGKLSKNSRGQVEIIQIRLPDEAQFIALNCFNLALLTFDKFIDRRLPEKSQEFKLWYATIRSYYLNLNLQKGNRIKRSA